LRLANGPLAEPAELVEDQRAGRGHRPARRPRSCPACPAVHASAPGCPGRAAVGPSGRTQRPGRTARVHRGVYVDARVSTGPSRVSQQPHRPWPLPAARPSTLVAALPAPSGALRLAAVAPRVAPAAAPLWLGNIRPICAQRTLTVPASNGSITPAGSPDVAEGKGRPVEPSRGGQDPPASAPPAGESPAGWYPDPQDPSRSRYWNGTAWTSWRRRGPGTPPPPPPYRPLTALA
jgi:Protein of unknown function (DUF2510)